MSNTATTSSGGGIGFAGLLTILFIGLKLGGVIDWSWWWVLSPIWISWGIALFILLIVGICLGIAKLLENAADKRATRLRAERARNRRGI